MNSSFTEHHRQYPRGKDLAVNLAHLDLAVDPEAYAAALATAKWKLGEKMMLLSPQEAAALQIEERKNRQAELQVVHQSVAGLRTRIGKAWADFRGSGPDFGNSLSGK